jgi:hypothetical protein
MASERQGYADALAPQGALRHPGDPPGLLDTHRRLIAQIAREALPLVAVRARHKSDAVDSLNDAEVVAQVRGGAERRTYRGERLATGRRVYVVGADGAEPLAPRHRRPLWSFSWGCHGAGAQELAWAIIRDATGDRQLADDWCLDLSIEIVSRLPRDEFQLEATAIVAWLEASTVGPALGVRSRPCGAPARF